MTTPKLKDFDFQHSTADIRWHAKSIQSDPGS